MIDSKYEQGLIKAFQDHHKCEACYTHTVSVIEELNGKIIWNGEVEVFTLYGHPATRRGYAWAYGREIVVVLELPPVISPRTAVQAAFAGTMRAR